MGGRRGGAGMGGRMAYGGGGRREFDSPRGGGGGARRRSRSPPRAYSLLLFLLCLPFISPPPAQVTRHFNPKLVQTQPTFAAPSLVPVPLPLSPLAVSVAGVALPLPSSSAVVPAPLPLAAEEVSDQSRALPLPCPVRATVGDPPHLPRLGATPVAVLPTATVPPAAAATRRVAPAPARGQGVSHAPLLRRSRRGRLCPRRLMRRSRLDSRRGSLRRWRVGVLPPEEEEGEEGKEGTKRRTMKTRWRGFKRRN